MISIPRALASGVYRAQEWALGRPTFAMLAELERSQWSSREEIEALQRVRLNALLDSALRHSPWHAERIRAAGLDGQIGARTLALGDLRRLPTMTRSDARTHVERLVWRDAPGGVVRYTTGGSTGEPLIFCFGRARQASDAAGRMRARRWWGVEPGEREVFLWGAPVELARADRIKTLRDRLVNQLLLNAFEMSAKTMDSYVEAINEWRPRVIYGYASSLALLCAHVRARGKRLRIPQLRVVSTTGEPLLEHHRALIGGVFGVPVAVEYGARDAGLIALESAEGSLLQVSETHIVEVLDARGEPAIEGEAIVTCLTSEAQPFIRYRTGDIVRLSDESGAGGRGLHVLAAVVGRQTDFIVASDGRIMHALAVIYVLRAVPGIAQFKIVQHAVDRLEVLIVPAAGFDENAREAVVGGLRARLGQNVRIDLRLEEAIAPEASGKHRYVVSHVALDPALQEAAA